MYETVPGIQKFIAPVNFSYIKINHTVGYKGTTFF